MTHHSNGLIQELNNKYNNFWGNKKKKKIYDIFSPLKPKWLQCIAKTEELALSEETVNLTQKLLQSN